MHNLAALQALLQEPRRIVITTHIRPDGDAMGSALGMCHYLQVQGHLATVVVPTEVPDYLHWMPGSAECIVADVQTVQTQAAVAAAELIICLDFGLLSRCGAVESAIRESKAPILHLDHHIELEDFATYLYRDVAASSTCELVYRLIGLLASGFALNKTIATCLYTGIMTDTGSFRFGSTSAAVHMTVAKLMEAGVNVPLVHHLCFSNYTHLRTQFLGHCLLEGMKVMSELHTAYIVVSAADQARFQVRSGDTEGIVNYALGIRGINFGVIMVEYPNEIRMSFRSVGQFSANAFAAHFNGGGHYNAAGGRSQTSLAETEARFLTLLAQHAAELNYIYS